MADRTRATVAGWLGARSSEWLAHITTAQLAPGEATPVKDAATAATTTSQ